MYKIIESMEDINIDYTYIIKMKDDKIPSKIGLITDLSYDDEKLTYVPKSDSDEDVNPEEIPINNIDYVETDNTKYKIELTPNPGYRH